MDIETVSNTYANDLIAFLKPYRKGRKSYLRTDTEIISYISCLTDYKLSYIYTHGIKASSLYSTNQRKLMNNIVIIIFPYDNLVFYTPYSIIKDMTLIPAILEEKFSDKPIKFKYFNSFYNKIFTGPKIVVVSSPIESVLVTIADDLHIPLNDNRIMKY